MKTEITTKEFTILAVIFLILSIAAVVSFFIPPVGKVSIAVINLLLIPFLYMGAKSTLSIFKEIFKK